MRHSPNQYRRRLFAAGVALSGAVALSGCSGSYISGPPTTTVSTPNLPLPTLSPEQQASPALVQAVHNVLNSIFDDAEKQQSHVVAAPYGASNWQAMHANNEAMVDTRIPQFSLQYHQANGELFILSQDLYFTSNTATTTNTYNGILVVLSTPPSPNSLDNLVYTGKNIGVEDIRSVVNDTAHPVVLKTVMQQQGIPYVKDTMQLMWDGSYQWAHEIADPNTLPTAQPAGLVEIDQFTTRLYALEAQLSQGIG